MRGIHLESSLSPFRKYLGLDINPRPSAKFQENWLFLQQKKDASGHTFCFFLLPCLLVKITVSALVFILLQYKLFIYKGLCLTDNSVRCPAMENIAKLKKHPLEICTSYSWTAIVQQIWSHTHRKPLLLYFEHKINAGDVNLKGQ